jgi:hypothetical protein
MRRKLLFVGAFLAHAVQAVANDWGMGEANSKIAPHRVDSFQRYLELACTIAIAPRLTTCRLNI